MDYERRRPKKRSLGSFLYACPYALIMIVVCGVMWYGKGREFILNYDSDKPFYTNVFGIEMPEEEPIKLNGGKPGNNISVSGNSMDMYPMAEDDYIDLGDNEDTGYEYGYWDENGNLDLNRVPAGSGAVADTPEPEPEIPQLTSLPEYDPTVYPYNQGTIVGSNVYYQATDYKDRYCTDPGRIALTSIAEYSVVDDTYFDDACFIGDSRMCGIFYYGSYGAATFMADTGYGVNGFMSGKAITCMNEGKKYKLEEMMESRTFGKVYIMLGLNDCGFYDTAGFKDRYAQLIAMIREKQPEATIYLLANLNISQSAEKNDKTGCFNMYNVNDKNDAIADLANPDGGIYYLNYNNMFCDDLGYLRSDYSFDGFHLSAPQYAEWMNYFRTHAIVKY